MKRPSTLVFVIIIVGLITGCAYFQKKDEPPPLPPIEETKPPLGIKGGYFKAFPWTELQKPLKDGNDPDSFLYTTKEGDTLESVAEKTMGDPSLATGLASYNGLTSPTSVQPNEKIVIPHPIIGVSSQLLVKEKGEKDFSQTKPFDTTLKKGDQYKLRLEPNINGYCYVFREGTKGTTLLYPSVLKKTDKKTDKKAAKKQPEEPLMRETGKVTAHEPIVIPTGKAGFSFDPKSAGDRIYVFLAMRKIPELEDLKDKKKITVVDIQDVMHRVKIADVHSEERPYTLLRISDPSEILGFSLNLQG